MLAVDGVPRRVLEPRVDILPVRNEIGVDLLDGLAGDQAEARVARGGDQIEAAAVHQCHHLVGGAGNLDVDLQPVAFSKSVTQS